MGNFIAAAKGEIGFGIDNEDAQCDLRVNICKRNIQNDETGEFLQRRKKLNPWMPKPNMLHITGIGCLIYENGSLRNTKNSSAVFVREYGPSIYYYLARTLGCSVTYSDIVVVLRPELNTLFGNISTEFMRIEDMPYIKVIDEFNGFKPTTVYKLISGINIGISNDFVGIKRAGDKMYYAVEFNENISLPAILSYVGYRMGIMSVERNLTDGKESKVMG